MGSKLSVHAVPDPNTRALWMLLIGKNLGAMGLQISDSNERQAAAVSNEQF
jgi:hypothetical protein